MAKKLKVFQTSLGFYDLAIAAPSMKAALEAWGADSNLFHQGVAKESKDPDVLAATMSKPGVILRRPVGSDGPFTEQADLPTDLPGVGPGHTPRKARSKPEEPRSKPNKPAARPIDDKAARKSALAFEATEKRRERERRRQEATREKQRKRRQQATAKAEAALKDGKRQHDERTATIEAERAALERKAQAEDARWSKERERLETALRRARD